jgi:segregation and condensation protein B
MLGQRSEEPTSQETAGVEKIERGVQIVEASTSYDDCEISPRSIVEAMLFVGRPDGHALSAREMAAAMRDVSPREVESVVQSLNDVYRRDAAPYTIVGEATGYRLTLRDEFVRVRDKFQRRVREARLAPAALEVLSIVAYHQPIARETIDDMRGASSGGVLRSLVRRELVRVERPADRSKEPSYFTTPRFLKLFGLGSLDELPRHSETKLA